jgi:hypothetical protein
MNGTTPDHTPSDSNDPSEIRHEIEETRAEMSETIDAIQAKLDPQRVKERLTDTVREATVGRAQYYADRRAITRSRRARKSRKSPRPQ